MEKKKITIYDIFLIGLMAAVVFVATNFQIIIPTAIDNTRIHFGNIFCLLAGMLLGGLRGGLAAGIGSMLFDFTNPMFIASAPWTLLFKFAMAFVCGVISNARDRHALKIGFNIAGAISGALLYVVLYVSRNFIESYYFLRNPLDTTIAVTIQKGTVSLVNAVIAVCVSIVLLPVFRKAMDAAKAGNRSRRS